MYKILIIEDEEFLRKLYKDAFNAKGYRTEAAVNGRKGIEKLQEYKPDLILLDLRMPEMDGYQFLQEVKNNSSMKRYPVILLTSSQEIREIGKCLSLGAIGYLDKSGSPSDLVKKVETIFKAFITVSGNAQKDYNMQNSM